MPSDEGNNILDSPAFVVWNGEVEGGLFVLRNTLPDESYDFTDVRVRRESAKAFLCEIGDGQFWVPKSQIVKSDGGRLTTTRWWAEVSGAQEAFESGQAAQRSQPSSTVQFPTASIIFRRLAAKYHPDRNPDGEEFMKDLNELWQAVRKDTKPP